ncbi:hypothetical protein [Proteiniphilum saccharofermentans]|uniref:hypothetical protein n=1 Tax=Proteiniphilum saccharofermentans TaxID=1642647 RepID=UPI0028AB0D25|nr:hypothetical protein [Proteiniphilum saccharofermentans]
MRKGLTSKMDAIIGKVAAMESIKPYILCGGTITIFMPFSGKDMMFRRGLMLL